MVSYVFEGRFLSSSVVTAVLCAMYSVNSYASRMMRWKYFHTLLQQQHSLNHTQPSYNVNTENIGSH